MIRFKECMAVLLLAVLLPSISFANDHEDGLVWVGSAHSVSTTVERLQKIFDSKGVTLFALIDHSSGARSIGQALPPTQLLIFGNPKLGTPLMQCQSSIAIDLPQKMLVSEDSVGRVWIAYNDPAYLAERHNLKGCDAVIKKITTVLNRFATTAAAR